MPTGDVLVSLLLTLKIFSLDAVACNCFIKAFLRISQNSHEIICDENIY